MDYSLLPEAFDMLSVEAPNVKFAFVESGVLKLSDKVSLDSKGLLDELDDRDVANSKYLERMSATHDLVVFVHRYEEYSYVYELGIPLVRDAFKVVKVTSLSTEQLVYTLLGLL